METNAFPVSVFKRAWGTVYELFNVRGKFTVAIEVIPAGKLIGRHYHNNSKEIEIILDGMPLVNNNKATPGDIFIWNPTEIHEYNNVQSQSEAFILTISIPSFDIEDEIFI